MRSLELTPTEGAIYEQGVKGPRVTFTLRCPPRGLARLMAPMVAKTMRAEVSQLERLRAVLGG
jgi:hypothetical protein